VVQLLGNNFKDGQDVVGLNPELITILKDECRRMQIHLDELRQLAKQSRHDQRAKNADIKGALINSP
jgi:hypothetical protein